MALTGLEARLRLVLALELQVFFDRAREAGFHRAPVVVDRPMLTLAEPTRIVGSAARLTLHPLQVKRRDLFGGLLHEYEAAA